MTNQPLPVMLRGASQSVIYGPVTLFRGRAIPQWVRYRGVWPRITVVFHDDPRTAVSKTVSQRSAGNQFSASLPAGALGLPETITKEDNSGVCHRINDLEYQFDFDPEVTQEAVVQKGWDVLLQFSELRTVWEANNWPGSLEEAMGIKISLGEEEDEEPPPPQDESFFLQNPDLRQKQEKPLDDDLFIFPTKSG